MLERFHVPSDIAVHVAPEDMQATVVDIFLKMGMPADDADKAAEVLVYADIRGIETHGVSNMLRGYVKAFGDGRINPTPNPRIVREMRSRKPVQALLEESMGCGTGVCYGCAVFTRKGVRLVCKDGPRFELTDAFR